MTSKKIIMAAFRSAVLITVAALCISCDMEDYLMEIYERIYNDVPVDPSADFQFGYEKEMETYKGKKKNTSVVFVPWLDEDRVQEIRQDTSATFDYDYDINNVVEYREGQYAAYLQRRDSDWKVRSITVSSSDTTLLTISKGSDAYRYNFHIKGVGKCDIALTVVATDTIRKVYHMKIMDKMTFGLYVNDFWNGANKCRIRYKCTDLPANVDAMTLYVRDSVQVCGVCEYFNYDAYGDKAQYVYDTTFYAKKSHYDNYKRDTKRLLRNVSPAVRKYNGSSKKVEGTGLRYIQGTSPAQFDTVKLNYYYKCHFVKLMMEVVCDCPYIMFDYVLNSAPSDEADTDKDIEDSDELVSEEGIDTYFAVDLKVYNESYGSTEDLAQKMADCLKEHPNDTTYVNAKLDSLNAAKQKFEEENPGRIKYGDEEDEETEKK